MLANADAWVARAKAVLSGQHVASEVIQSAISLLTTVYGPQSAQLNAFTTGLAQIAKLAPNPINSSHHQEQLVKGAIRNTIAEIEGGLIVSLRAQVAGEIFAELVGLSKETLEDDTETAKNVSAVLIAAAFEDLMRRMGSELAGVVGRPKLEEVLTALKNAGILKGVHGQDRTRWPSTSASGLAARSAVFARSRKSIRKRLRNGAACIACTTAALSEESETCRW